LTDALVAIDGSKFKAVNNRDKNFTKAKMKRRLAEVEASVARYLTELDAADAAAPPEETRSLKEKIAALEEEMDRLKKFEVRMLEAPDQQLSLTDPDARSMKSRGSGIVGYNVQTAVDTAHHLIVAHEVTNAPVDRRLLHRMAKQAKEILAPDSEETLSVVADQGYYKGEELLACEAENIVPYIPKTDTAGKRAKGEFPRSAFRYIPEDDEYECPAGERLIYRFTRNESGKEIRRYWSSECPRCPLKSACTPSQQRRVSRWEHEEVIEAAEDRLKQHPEMMNTRRATVEHPFGTLKAWMGSTHFLTKTLDRASTEMGLHVLAYNMKRAINLLGAKAVIAAI
jgi:hypothetical protein